MKKIFDNLNFNLCKWTLAIGSSYYIPRFCQRKISPIPATTGLALMGYALIAATIYNAALTVFLAYQGEFKDKQEMIENIFSGNVNRLSNLTLTTAIQLSYPYFFVHENGHFLLAKLLFKESKAFPTKIKIDPFNRGNTTYAVSLGLTKIGETFGKERSIQLITMGGMIASTTMSCVSIFASFFFKKGQILLYWGSSQSLLEFLYQCSYFHHMEPRTGHDLSQLILKYRVKPVYPLGAIGLLPIMIYLFCNRQFNID